MKGIFLEDLVKYEDLSSDIYRGVNRMVDDGTGTNCKIIMLAPNEKEDQSKKELALKFFNNKLWITSDLHLNHKNRNSANFFNEIVNEINSKVSIEDAILFLGDMGKKDDTTQKQYIKNFLNKLNCKNVFLILGNHDILSLSDWYDVGFSFVTDKIITDIDGKTYKFTHFPSNIDDCFINFHGHIHGEKEYWNLPWQRHIDCYIHLNQNKIWQFNDYLKFYSEGLYKGKTIKKNFK